MATSKKITNAVSISMANDMLYRVMVAVLTDETTFAPIMEAINSTCKEYGFTLAELSDKLSHMAETATKPRSKGEKTLTKDQMQMLVMVDEAIAAMQAYGEPVGTKWLMEHVRYCTSAQKASAMMRKAIEQGRVVRGEPVKGKAIYILTE